MPSKLNNLQQTTRWLYWLYCVEYPQYSIRLEARFVYGVYRSVE